MSFPTEEPIPSVGSQLEIKDIIEVYQSSTNLLQEELSAMKHCKGLAQVRHIFEIVGGSHSMYAAPNLEKDRCKKEYKEYKEGFGFLPISSFVHPLSFITGEVLSRPGQITRRNNYLLSGPRPQVAFHPTEIKAAVATCGGLCPGLNVIIREIVTTLELHYDSKEIYAIKNGYMGFYSIPWQKLTSRDVKYIHQLGGSIIGSSRGGFDLKKIVDSIEEKKITHVFLIGGDGTMRGAMEISKEISRRKLKACVVGIPKTIDNDIPIIDRSFGFDTCIEEAVKAIKSVDVEANAAPHGVGIVKLMGRYSGHITMHAALASRVTNICLIPESPFELYGEKGVFQYVLQRLKEKDHCVIVIGEGCNSETILDTEVKVVGKDPSGNVIYENVASLFMELLAKFMKEKNFDHIVKFVDPAYMTRSVAANSADNILCTRIAQNAVHSSIAGFTHFVSGMVNDCPAMIPLEEIVATRNDVDIMGVYWTATLSSTGQPAFLSCKGTCNGCECKICLRKQEIEKKE